MPLPSKQQCFDLWDKYEVPMHIREHMQQVTRVADATAAHISNTGCQVNQELVNRGALLHDIAKMIQVESKGKISHKKRGAEIVQEEGYGQELANVVLNHGLGIFSDDLSLEEQIVNYADKRVTHDTIVLLCDRMNDLQERYSGHHKDIQAKVSLFEAFEKRYGLEALDFSG